MADELYLDAVAIVTADRTASTTYVQRRLQLGYVMAVEPVNGAAQNVGAPVPRPFHWSTEDLLRSGPMIEKGTSAETVAARFGCSVGEAQRRIRQVAGRRKS